MLRADRSLKHPASPCPFQFQRFQQILAPVLRSSIIGNRNTKNEDSRAASGAMSRFQCLFVFQAAFAGVAANGHDHDESSEPSRSRRFVRRQRDSHWRKEVPLSVRDVLQCRVGCASRRVNPLQGHCIVEGIERRRIFRIPCPNRVFRNLLTDVVLMRQILVSSSHAGVDQWTETESGKATVLRSKTDIVAGTLHRKRRSPGRQASQRFTALVLRGDRYIDQFHIDVNTVGEPAMSGSQTKGQQEADLGHLFNRRLSAFIGGHLPICYRALNNRIVPFPVHPYLAVYKILFFQIGTRRFKRLMCFFQCGQSRLCDAATY